MQAVFFYLKLLAGFCGIILIGTASVFLAHDIYLNVNSFGLTAFSYDIIGYPSSITIVFILFVINTGVLGLVLYKICLTIRTK